MYDLTKEFRVSRNEIAHMMTEEISLFPIMNRENVLNALKRYLYMLSKLNVTNKFSQAYKRNEDLIRQKSIANSIFNDVGLIELQDCVIG